MSLCEGHTRTGAQEAFPFCVWSWRPRTRPPRESVLCGKRPSDSPENSILQGWEESPVGTREEKEGSKMSWKPRERTSRWELLAGEGWEGAPLTGRRGHRETIRAWPCAVCGGEGAGGRSLFEEVQLAGPEEGCFMPHRCGEGRIHLLGCGMGGGAYFQIPEEGGGGAQHMLQGKQGGQDGLRPLTA